MNETGKMKIRPSMLNHLAKCPCFRPSEGESDAAAEGTFLHAAVENNDDRGLDDEQLEQVTKCRQQEAIYLEDAVEQYSELPIEIDLTNDA